MNRQEMVKKVSSVATRLAVAIAMVVAFSAIAYADLTVVGTGTFQDVWGVHSDQLIYDSGQNITWLDYSAPAATWQNQVNWASGLTVNFNGQNVTGWRLPTTVDNRSSFYPQPNPTSSEMAFLYYTEMGKGSSQSGYGWNNVGPFKNLQDNSYWSGTEYSADPSQAWSFSGPFQGSEVKFGYLYALAVYQGNVAATPIPAAVYLFGSGLLGLVGIRKRTQR